MASPLAPASLTNILDSLPARPPTPPREAPRGSKAALKPDVCQALPLNANSSLQTPSNATLPTTPAATGSNPSSSRVRKRVEWSSHTDYREPQSYIHCSKQYQSPQLSVTSSASSKPIKGILKLALPSDPLTSSPALVLDESSSALNITEMLDSTIKQLAGSDRTSKLDAYMMLSRALKASNNLPDRVALQNKMSLFMQFIQRDITAKTADESPDSSLMKHSLTLLATFLHFPAIASTLTNDFGVFMMDHSIRSFEDEGVPKDVVRHLMQVVAFQNFSPKVLTSERVGRLVTALHRAENHVKGKSIVMSRLHIYKRLVRQCRNHMAAHCDWLKDLFTDMLSTVKDIRSQAISFGMEAGFAFRSEKHVVRKVSEVLQTLVDNETYIEFYISQLQEMMKGKQSCSAVPQIWSVMILFLRYPLDRWHHYGPWLTLAQSAFNMTDSLTKSEANFAWNRHVFLSLSNAKTNPKLVSTLCQPLLSQLKRKVNPKQQEDGIRLRGIVIGGICNLYYYAFAPGGDKYTPDLLWDVAVQPVITQLVSLDGKPNIPGDGSIQAAQLLIGLLDMTTPRKWRQDRIMDVAPVKPDELPAIESKWIRKNCDKVLDSVGSIIQNKFDDLADQEGPLYRLWQALVSSIAVASAKDIKVSDDTAKFLAHALSLLSKALLAKASEGDDVPRNATSLSSVFHYVQILTEGLGILPFTEKKLSMTVSNTFEPVTAPSQRLGKIDKPQGIVRIPLHHLFIMLSAVSARGIEEGEIVPFFNSLLGPFLMGKSARARFDLTRELLELIPRNTPLYGPWMLAADCAEALVSQRLSSPKSHKGSDKLLGPEYREIVSLLNRGICSHPNLPPKPWLSLLESLSTRVTTEFGDAGCSLVVIDPIAKAVLDTASTSTGKPAAMVLHAVSLLLRLARPPRNQQALEAARAKLWGTPLSMPKVGSVEPLDSLYRMGNYVLTRSYESHDTELYSGIQSLLQAVNEFLRKALPHFPLRPLVKLQAGLSTWIQDEKNRLSSTDQTLMGQISSLWDYTCSAISSQGLLEKRDMNQIEPLLIAGLSSTQAVIVDRTAGAWNAIMKENEDLTCSDSLLSAISSLGPKADTFFSVSRRLDEFGAQDVSPERLQGDQTLLEASSTSPDQNVSATVTSPRKTALMRPMTRKRCLDSTTGTMHEMAAKRTNTTTPKPRHDDSQVNFEPIASSSPPQEESQHLTERQKEVRERQRETSALYSDEQISSHEGSAHKSPRLEGQANVVEGGDHAQQSTPKRSKSFENLISLTPTPRRGDFLQLDDSNDPPSSPPAPRPYPLLVEIQARSRIADALESWEFSSPPGSPPEKQGEEDSELPRPPSSTAAPTNSPRRDSSDRSLGKKKRIATKNSRMANASNSERSTDKKGPNIMTRSARKIESLLTVQGLPREGAITRARKALQTPQPGQSSRLTSAPSRRESSCRTGLQAQDGESEPDQQEGNSSALSRESSESPSQAGEVVSSLSTSRKRGDAEPSKCNGCILVHADSPSQSPAKPETPVQEAPPPIRSSSSPSDNTAQGGPRRKRKRGPNDGRNRTKRRRPMNNKGDDSATSALLHPSSPASIAGDGDENTEGIETRSGLRKRQIRESRMKAGSAGQLMKEDAKEVSRATECEDTDEEVLSQLVTESHAASQQSQIGQAGQAYHSEDADESFETRSRLNGAEMRSESTSGHSPTKGVENRQGAKNAVEAEKKASIMDTLHSGLEQLRNSSLTREKVYEVEDILMDLKRELFEAERRGRSQGRSRKRKSRGH